MILVPGAATGARRSVQKYLRKGHPIDSRGPYGKTALFFAAANNHIAVIRLLIDHGASPSLADTGLERSERVGRGFEASEARGWRGRRQRRSLEGPWGHGAI